MAARKTTRFPDIGPERFLRHGDGTSSQTVAPASKNASTNDSNAPAANTAAVLTYAAAAVDEANVIGMVAWSYSGTPSGGNLKIEDGTGSIIFQVDITASGPGFFEWLRPKRGSLGTSMIVTLTAGGSGVLGKINATQWTE